MNLTAEQIKWIATAVVVAAIFGCGCAVGFGLRGNIANAAESKLRKEHALAMKAVTDAAALAAQQALARQTELNQQIAALDATHTEEIERAKADIDRLTESVRTGERRLYIATRGPACGGGVSKGSGASGVDHGAARAELDPAAAGRIVGIAAAGDAAIRQLKACQDYAKAVSGRQ